jgi:copper homeostasis protein
MIEIIATTLDDAKDIERYGGDRIELVSGLQEGGLTPSRGLIKHVVEAVNIPVNVIIRPHAKSFTYTHEELSIMREDIILARELGANGVVLGVLDTNNRICEASLGYLLDACGGLDVTFHRAIDELTHPLSGIKMLRRYPQIKTILTSGGKGPILCNLETIKAMAREAGHMEIMVGGGLTLENLAHVEEFTGAPSYHFGRGVRTGGTHLGDIVPEKLQSIITTLRGEP